MKVIMYIINLFLYCVCFVIIWYVRVATVFLSLMYIINIINVNVYLTTITSLNRLLGNAAPIVDMLIDR